MATFDFQNITLQDPAVLGLILLIGIIVVMTIWITRLERRLKQLSRGKNGESLEGVIQSIGAECDNFTTFRKELEQYLAMLEKRMRKSARHVETTRFNPFRGDGSGGNQSFSTAFMDEDGNGVILTGLHSRDSMRVFAKPITNHTCEYELSEEERKIIEGSRSRITPTTQ